MIMIEFAKFHAAAYHLIQKWGGCSNFASNYPVYNIPHIYGIFKTELAMINKKNDDARVSASINGLEEMSSHKELVKRLVRSKDQVCNSISLIEGTKGKFVTLTHGDCWFNNIMMKDDDVRLIDFQTIQLASPVYDLVDFIYSSLSPKSRRQHLDHWLQLYHSELLKVLNSFGYTDNLYPFEDMVQEFKKMLPLGLRYALYFSHVISMHYCVMFL